jgi:hypothetical protein
MKPSSIEVGKTYKNKGAGRTKRKVLVISKHLEAPWFSPEPRPDDFIVQYEQDGEQRTLYLRSFASWAGGEIDE